MEKKMQTAIKTAMEWNRGCTAARVALGIAFFYICSNLTVPMWPVPITMQMFAVYFLGLVLTPKESCSSTTAWLALGALGLPVFASSVGGFLGPTAGYRFGMIIATTAISYMMRARYTPVISCICGAAIVHIFGCAWLVQFVGLENVIQCGVVPFIVPEILKITLACAILKKVTDRS
jgi:biotin transport system substrate-specific component